MPTTLPITTEQVAEWHQRLSRAQEIRRREEPLWQESLATYQGKPLTALPTTDYVNVNKDFAIVRQKMAQLFYKTPEVQLTARTPLMAGREPAISTFAAVLNAKLGVHDLNVKATVDQTLFNVLVCGIGVTKIGYERGTVDLAMPSPLPGAASPVPTPLSPVETSAPEPAPAAPPPETPQEALTTEPGPAAPAQTIPVPIVDRWYWEATSPQRILLPAGFTGPLFDEADWIAVEFWKDVETAKRIWGLPEDFTPGQSGTPPTLNTERASVISDPLVHGYEVWYRASVYDATVVNWQRQRLLVLIDGAEEAVRHEWSPHQTVLKTGELSGNSLIGYPIHPLVLNPTTDVAYPASDTAMIRPLVKELCKGRSQMVQQRDRSLPMRVFSLARGGGKEGLDKYLSGENQAIVAVDDFDPNNMPLAEIARVTYPRENFTFNDIVERDVAQSVAMGRNQTGAETDTVRTATESKVVQANVDVRLAFERQLVIDWFIRGVAKLATLIQRYADQAEYVAVVGPEGSQALTRWDKTTIQGRFAYTIRPDSSQWVDANEHRKQLIDLYNYLARDPQINRSLLLADLVRAFHYDPATLIQREPPAPKPDPPNVSYRFGGEDLNPGSPQFPIVLQILQQAGVQISPAAMQAAIGLAERQQALGLAPPTGTGVPGAAPRPGPGPTAHPGMAETAEVLNRHQDDVTGGIPGVTP